MFTQGLVHSMGVPTVGIAGLPIVKGKYWFVDGESGNNGNPGDRLSRAFKTATYALTRMTDHDALLFTPGGYNEALTIPRALDNVVLFGLGGRGAAYIAPSTTNATALTIEADDVTVINVGADGDGTGDGCLNRGARTRLIGCKIEGGTIGLRLTLGTVAQIAALTHGKGADLWITDCEIAWNTKGVQLVATDYGALTQVRFRRCVFHDNTAADFEESGGTVSIRYRDLDIGACNFLRQEDGTEPTAYILLNDDNGNKGVVHGCTFPSALAGGKNLVSTGLIWTGNLHTGGISTTQPS